MSTFCSTEVGDGPQEQDTESDNTILSSERPALPRPVYDLGPIPPPISKPLSPIECDQWAENLPQGDHVQFFRSTDWAATPLGPLKSWSTILRLYTFNVLADSQAATLYWGPQRIAVYNAAFVPLAGKLHPALMGSPFNVAFPELVARIGPIFQAAESTGRAADVYEQEMFVERNQFTEESYFSGNFSPLRGPSGKIEGFYNAVHEITKAKINDRRRAMLNMMEAPPASDTRKLAYHVMPLLELNQRDFPMVLLYKMDEDTIPGTSLLLLRGKIGVPDGHQLAMECLDLSSNDGLVPFLRKSRSKITTIPVDEKFDGVDWQGFGEASRFVSILPILGPERLFGFLMVGANPRRPMDEVTNLEFNSPAPKTTLGSRETSSQPMLKNFGSDHHQFMRDLSSKLSSIFAAILSAEETRRRAERLEKELADSMKQSQYMAECASVGMARISPDGIIRWANPEFYSITGHSREEDSQYFSFLDVYVDEDRPKALNVWTRLMAGQNNLSEELKLKRLYQPPIGDAEPARVLCNSSARVEDGKLQTVFAFITDVSNFRWAEASEARKAIQAEEAKRQQEEFIDFVSHELRNPLSAIFQLAETIVTSFPVSEYGTNITNGELAEAIRGNIDNANTIIMCATHQKRIVDDVLTLSKLSYNMLSVSPRPTQLAPLVEKCMKMFDAQLSSYDIKVTIFPHKSVLDPKNGWVLCDESRIQQIFLNLITNAIKFTKAESRREISIRYGVTVSSPRQSFLPDINWAPNQQQFEDITSQTDKWGLGQPLYLTFAVTDTGIGMTGEEIKKLFGRFTQANARTTIKYGGSGLGLFLSHRLAEKQSGEIGVASQPGKGSTFAFYVKSRRTEQHGFLAAESVRQAPIPRSLTNHVSRDLTGLDLKKIHVLLVEDNLVNQQVVHMQLVKAGCVVYLANHGVEALDMVRASDIWYEQGQTPKHLDVILMDWEMPIMDGLQASREIRALQKANKITRHIEIIATTANAREEQVETALASGCDCVVSKPFMVKDLLAKIHERLGTSASRTNAPRSISDP